MTANTLFECFNYEKQVQNIYIQQIDTSGFFFSCEPEGED